MNGSLINALQDSRLYDHEVESFSVIETHISWVILTGHYAYKIKKPVDFGFLDFSTLYKRRYFCQQELELNRRFAPELYLSVIAIGGTPSAPRLFIGSTTILSKLNPYWIAIMTSNVWLSCNDGRKPRHNHSRQ